MVKEIMITKHCQGMTVVESFLTGSFFVVFGKMMKQLLFLPLKGNIKALLPEDLNDADPYFLRCSVLLALWDFMVCK